jgi:ADP-dependent NAD(P)H-hydrate dehydratase / NAD(P)H-hydrate epimerase
MNDAQRGDADPAPEAPAARTIAPTLPDADVAAPVTEPGAAPVTEPGAAPDTASDAAPTLAKPARPGMPPAKRRRVIAGAVIGGALLTVGAGAWLGPAFLIRRAAGRIGVELDFDGYELQGSSLRLTGARASLEGVRGMTARIDEVRVDLKGWAPKGFDAKGVAVSVEGSAAERAIEVSSWSSRHPEFYAIPGAARDVRVEWRGVKGAAPWLTATGGTLSSSGKGASVRAASASVGGVPVGTVGASWAVEATTLRLALGSDVAAEAPLVVEVKTAPKPVAEVTLRRVKLETLGAALGVAMPMPGASASGSASLRLEGMEGSFEVKLAGWVPPHPREIDRIVHGKETVIASRFQVSRDFARMTLSDTAVSAGSLKLKGNGTVDRVGDHAVAKIDLKGKIACADVARSAASSSWGDALGKIAGDVAEKAVEGSVAIGVHIEADSRNLAGAKVKNEVGVGCGLRL